MDSLSSFSTTPPSRSPAMRIVIICKQKHVRIGKKDLDPSAIVAFAERNGATAVMGGKNTPCLKDGQTGTILYLEAHSLQLWFTFRRKMMDGSMKLDIPKIVQETREVRTHFLLTLMTRVHGPPRSFISLAA